MTPELSGTGDSGRSEQEKTKTPPNDAKSPSRNTLKRCFIKITLLSTCSRSVPREATKQQFLWRRVPLSSSLNFHKVIFVGHDHVEINFTLVILFVAKVKQHIGIHDANAGGSDLFV